MFSFCWLCSITRDSVAVANPETTTFGVGGYAYNCSVVESANYFASSATSTLNVIPENFGGTNGSITFNSSLLNTTLNFLIPYHFVTQAYMNLSGYTNIYNDISYGLRGDWNLNESIFRNASRESYYYNGGSANMNVQTNFTYEIQVINGTFSYNHSYVFENWSADNTNGNPTYKIYIYNYSSNSYVDETNLISSTRLEHEGFSSAAMCYYYYKDINNNNYVNNNTAKIMITFNNTDNDLPVFQVVEIMT